MKTHQVRSDSRVIKKVAAALALLLAPAGPLLLANPPALSTETAQTPARPIRVALFEDAGGSTTPRCVQATLSILRTNGLSPATLSPAEIRCDALTNFDVVMFPGGSGSGEAKALQEAGCSKIEQFVAHGGGYIGTCAGAYLAPLGYDRHSSWLQIVGARIQDVEHWERGVGRVQIRIVNATNALVAGFPEYVSAQYINGPLLSPQGSARLAPCEVEAVFVSDLHAKGAAGTMPGKACLTCSRYGSGHCVLFSFHPELTPGLELMDLRAVKWAAGKL